MLYRPLATANRVGTGKGERKGRKGERDRKNERERSMKGDLYPPSKEGWTPWFSDCSYTGRMSTVLVNPGFL